MEESIKHHEAISALADGELSGDEFLRTVTRLGDSPDDRLTWLAYHVTGDVMRSGVSLARDSDTAFMRRFKQSLAQELPPSGSAFAIDNIAINEDLARAKDLNRLNNEAANDDHFRWKWMAGLASVVIVSLVGWQTVGHWGSTPGGAQLVQKAVDVPPTTLQASASAMLPVPEASVMLRDPQLDALMAAHRQFGGASALQMPTGFLRNATFDGADR